MERLSSVSFSLLMGWSTKSHWTSHLEEYDTSVLLIFLPTGMWLAGLKNLPLLVRGATKPSNIAKFENWCGSKVRTVEGHASLFFFSAIQHCKGFVAEWVALPVERCWGGYTHKQKGQQNQKWSKWACLIYIFFNYNCWSPVLKSAHVFSMFIILRFYSQNFSILL